MAYLLQIRRWSELGIELRQKGGDIDATKAADSRPSSANEATDTGPDAAPGTAWTRT